MYGGAPSVKVNDVKVQIRSHFAKDMASNSIYLEKLLIKCDFESVTLNQILGYLDLNKVGDRLLSDFIQNMIKKVSKLIVLKNTRKLHMFHF